MTERKAAYNAQASPGPALAVGAMVWWKPRTGFCREGPCAGHVATVKAEEKDGHILLETDGFEHVIARLDEVRAL